MARRRIKRMARRRIKTGSEGWVDIEVTMIMRVDRASHLVHAKCSRTRKADGVQCIHSRNYDGYLLQPRSEGRKTHLEMAQCTEHVYQNTHWKSVSRQPLVAM